MLVMAAARLGLRCHIYSDVAGPAFDVAARSTVGAFEDVAAIERFAGSVDVVTYEFENVPLAAARAAETHVPVRPGPKALAVAQDRLEEKRFVAALGIPVAPFAAIDDEGDLARAADAVGSDAILKTRRLGYDGKGQARVSSAAGLRAAFGEIGRAPAILEGFVPFAYEVSVLAVRALSGEIRFYDSPINTHRGGILATSAVPSPLPPADADQARAIARRIADALDYVGVLAVEMFYTGDETAPLIVNELAPRVHNSGHWTIEACAVSQFENHIRAVAGWPLGSTERHSDAVMENLIGAEADGWASLAADASLALHLYGKPEARPGRKMGHWTRLAPKSG